MSLLDPDIQVIKGSEKKQSWKEQISGTNPEVELKDQMGKEVGRFYIEDKVNRGFSLWDSEGNDLLKFFRRESLISRVEILDTNGNMRWKTNAKWGLIKDKIWLEDLEGEKILSRHDEGNYLYTIIDPNKKTVAEFTHKKWWKEFSIRIIDNSFDRLMILGFIFGLIIIHTYGNKGPEGHFPN